MKLQWRPTGYVWYAPSLAPRAHFYPQPSSLTKAEAEAFQRMKVVVAQEQQRYRDAMRSYATCKPSMYTELYPAAQAFLQVNILCVRLLYILSVFCLGVGGT